MKYITPHLQTFAALLKGRLFSLIFFLGSLSTGCMANAQLVVEAPTSGQSNSTNRTFGLNRGTAGNTLTLVVANTYRVTITNTSSCKANTSFTNTNNNSNPASSGLIKTINSPV